MDIFSLHYTVRPVNVHDNLLFDTSFTETSGEYEPARDFSRGFIPLPWTRGLMMERTGIRSNIPISFRSLSPTYEDSRIRERRSMQKLDTFEECRRYTRNDISLSDAAWDG